MRINLNKDIFDSYIPAINLKLINNYKFEIHQYDARSFDDVDNFPIYYLPINKNISFTDQHQQVLYNFDEKCQPQCTHCLLITG